MSATTARRDFLLGRFGTARAGARIGEGCLEPRGITCRACGEACPKGAIGFLPLAGGMTHALVDPARCDGCGECVASCPVGVIAVREGR